MGIFDSLKKSGKRFVENQQEIGRRNHALKQEKKKYNDELKKAVKSARRDAYKKEAINSAKIKAKMDAQRRFNPTQSSGSGMSAEARSIIYGSGGFGSPQQKVVEKIVQQRSSTPKKKKKKGSPKTRTVVKYVEKPAPKDAVADLLSRLPQ